ncbi:helix-turn-helix domain-containing protein [Rhodococcus hoagii]|nr:helix-turn-helix domain-containing protein [Prescottella equi]
MQLGWALPLEWDEDTIDDPAAEPVRARRGGSRSAAEVAANRREAAALAAEGMSAEAIAQELGVHERTVERYLAVAS